MEIGLRDQLDRVTKESRLLKQKAELLEKENALLKKSIFDLSIKYNAIAYRQAIHPVELDDGSLKLIHPTNLDSGVLSQKALLMETMVASTRDKHKDSKFFVLKSDLKEHSGAVYTVQFSPCGKWLASGSFDKTIRIWDTTSTPKEQHVFKRHTLSISEVCWSPNSKELVSGAFDQTCKTWDMETGQLIHSFECEGFVQCVQYVPSDPHLFVHGTTRKFLGLIDQRSTKQTTSLIKTEAMINSIYVYRDGTYIYSGDALGQLKVWDVRTLQCIDTQFNELTRKPISHLALSKTEEDDEPRYLAVNSYDNVLRVYDRGLAPPRSQNRLLHSLKGHKNKNWPIKSAFYNGDDFVLPNFRRSNSLTDHSDLLDASVTPEKTQEESCMLLATGSADPFAYIYAIGFSEGQNEMIQRLEGHSDRVYSIAFHPFEPILATCSADFSVKIWSSTGRGKRVFTL